MGPCARTGKNRDDEFFFFATHTGAELDLFWQDSGQNWGVEFKYGDAPKLTRSMSTVQKDLNLSHLWVVYPGDQGYRLKENISVVPLTDIGERWQYHLKI